VKKYFVFATPPKPFGGFFETWYKERSQCGSMYIRGGVMVPGLDFFFEKYVVFATPPKLFGRF
jgi:hypothetical protein